MADKFEPYPYCLSWDNKKNEIVVITYANLIEKSKHLKFNLDENNLIVLHFKTIFSFSFNSNLKDGDFFGFDNSATCSKEGEIFKFKIKLPEIERKTNDKCDTCNGTGEEPKIDAVCLDCVGDGKKRIRGTDNPYASLATLKLIFALLDFLLLEAEAKGEIRNQFLKVDISISQELLDGFSMWGDISRDFWERITNDVNSESILISMKQAYEAMWNRDGDIFSEYQFRADISRNGFMFGCPGNATCIITQKTDSFTGRKSFSYHNIDRPDQAFLLLVGLASLCDLIKEKIK